MLNKNSSDGEKTNIHYFRGSGENSNNVVIQNYNYQNEVIEKLLLDDNNQPISFETFSNPFAFLTIDEIEKESDVFTINLDNVKYLKLFELLTGVNDEAESMSISILKEYDGFDDISFEEDDTKYKELEAAWEKLPERDQLILKYLVIEDRNPLEIFDEMIQYVETTIPSEQYTRKQKQDAMSLMKRRAKLHLRMLIVEQRKQKKQ